MKASLVKVRPCSIVDNSNYCRLAEKEAEKDHSFFSNQFENMSNFKAHYLTTAPEIF